MLSRNELEPLAANRQCNPAEDSLISELRKLLCDKQYPVDLGRG